MSRKRKGSNRRGPKGAVEPTTTAAATAARRRHDGRALGRFRRRLVAGLLVVALVAGVSVSMWFGLRGNAADRSREPTAGPRVAQPLPLPLPPLPQPQPDLSAVDPPVREKVERMIGNARQHPRSADAWGRLAMTLDAHEMEHDAAAAYAYAAALDPADFRWPYLLGVLLSESGADDPLPWLSRAADLEPTYVPAHLRVAQALLIAGRTGEAEGAVTRALAIEPEYPYANFMRAKVAIARGEPRAALRHLEVSLSRDPEFRDAHNLMAEAYRRLGETERAREHARAFARLPHRAQVTDPALGAMRDEGVGPHWNVERGKALLAQGRCPEALREFQEAIRYRPTPGAHLGVGLALLGTGDRDGALAAFHRVLELDPQFAGAHSRIALLHAKAGRWPEAVAAAQAGHARVPADDDLARLLATFLAAAPDASVRDPGEAVRLMEAVIARDDPALTPDGVRVDNLDRLATAYASAGRYADAVSTAERALALAPQATNPRLAQAIRQRLEHFRRNEPYIETEW